MTLPLLAALGGMTGCQGPELDTQTFEVRYLHSSDVSRMLEPYVFDDREGAPGKISTAQGAVTVRETEDNLAKIARVLEQYDRPKPTVMLSFQIIEADGARPSDPAIAEVEAELRRLFRFEGYELMAETQVVGIQGTMIRQSVGISGDRGLFFIEGGVNEVRGLGSDTPTVGLSVQLSHGNMPNLLHTSVTVPVGHSIVLGTAEAPRIDGAVILVVSAEILSEGGA
jgi:hypothetical protein